MTCLFYLLKKILYSPEDIFLLLSERGREKGRERETEREKHWCERETVIGCLLLFTPTWDRTQNLSMCPEQELNLWSLGLWDNDPTNLFKSQGNLSILFYNWNFISFFNTFWFPSLILCPCPHLWQPKIYSLYLWVWLIFVFVYLF